MKIIKKIAAIMLSIMMVLGMCSVVGAEETTTSGTGTPGTTGSITINKAAPGETYKIYRILDLESYNETTGNYVYKLRNDKVAESTKSWSDFIKSSEIKDVYVTLDGDYVTWKDKADAAQFAKLALKYAKDNTTKIVADQTEAAPGVVSGATTSTVTFNNLQLGYYLVETSVGTVLALDTTKPNATIEEKNGVPSVDKVVKSGDNYKDNNTASIGDIVEFKTTIIAQPGAQNYVLHDKMDAGLKFDGVDSIKINLKKNGETTESLVEKTNYTIKTSDLESKNPCTFHIEFKQDFCDTLKANDQIIITYSATLNESAVIAGEGNKNETWLKYGDSSETKHDETITKTFEIPVFKYTDKSAKGGEAESPLEGAKFILREKDKNKEIGLKSITTPTGKEGAYYRFDKDATAATEVTTNNTGKFTIQGLAPGTYELVEKEAPKGYNKLSAPVEITIGNDGEVSYNTKTNATLVKVENKTGSILPSTGGMGTTLFYIFGAILVIGSGVVLITKKRMK